MAGVLYVLELVAGNWRIRATSKDHDDLKTATTALAALTALTNAGMPSIAQQTAAALPARPAGTTVHWQTWADPTIYMRGQDLGFKLPTPGAPDTPTMDGATWELVDQRNGTNINLELYNIPQDAVPRLTGVSYKINVGGSPVSLGLVYEGSFGISGMTDDVPVSIYLEYANYLGSGGWSDPRSITPNAGEFQDAFLTDLGAMYLRNNWSLWQLDLGLTKNTGITVTSAGAYPTGFNTWAFAMCACPFTADHYAGLVLQWTIATTTKLYSPGVSVRMEQPANAALQPAGVRLYATQTGWTLIGRDATTRNDVTLASGALGAFPTSLRLEAQGYVYRAYVSGTLVTTYTDTAHTYPVAGKPGVAAYWPSGAVASAVYMKSFIAGDI